MATSNTLVVNEPWLSIGCTLGEGPLYDHRTSTLHFVDIAERKVFHVTTRSCDVVVETFPDPVSCLALRKGGKGLACVASKGFALIGDNSTLEYIAKPLLDNEQPYTRFNDGACDSKGRFFAGTITSPEHGVPGRLYRYDPSDNSCEMVDSPFTDCNGLAWSPDDKTMYFTDSLVNKIYCYEYNDGQLSNRRLLIDAVSKGFSPSSFCDGLCVDIEGFIWSARWGGSRVVRFSPEGIVNFEILFPKALNITSCCFGGDNDDQLFVTSAHCGAIGGDASRQSEYPDSGHVFRIEFAGQFKGVRRYEFGL
ncbi:regucalcin [Coprinopsis marcescibilis]|uniref:Regucalcin n=1 Tax=Coprinopsis marcescibilis TaxID=230819 RepID=A0A5C3LDI0_COPMA|nr:regucalcin [Coprinopsis marcescibilis]